MKKSILGVLYLSATLIPALAQNKITLEDIWKKGTFRAASFAGFQGMKDGLHYAKFMENRLMSVPYIPASSKDTPAQIADFSKLVFEGKRIVAEDYTFSDDEQVLLISAASEQIYRHSSKSDFYAFYPKTGEIKRIFREKVMYATLSLKWLLFTTTICFFKT
jgi:dipeptidyl-peptidase-4